MSTREEAVQASINVTQKLEPLLALLGNIGKQYAELTTGLSAAHESSQLAAAIIDALKIEPEVIEKVTEVLPPNFLDVKAFANVDGKVVGAKGDGRTDDTVMLQLAIDTAAKLGMVCYFSKGTYMVDAIKSLRPRFGSEWMHHPESLLAVIPNDEQKTNCVLIEAVTDVFIHGIRIEGDRIKHDYSNPGTEEWGHGIKVIGTCARIFIRRHDIRRCHGDGISASGRGVYIGFGKLIENRRQGLTIGGLVDGWIMHNEISNTGKITVDGVDYLGTDPQAAIDIEPDKNPARNILIEGNYGHDNTKAGLLIWVREEVGVSITEIIVRDNRFHGNSNQIETKALGAGRIEFEAYGNDLKRRANSGVNMKIGIGTTAIIGGEKDKLADFNTFATPDEKRADMAVFGKNSAMQYDIQIGTAQIGQVAPKVQINWNNLK
jgi:hypothetical protein